ncbi:cytochrome c oxidase subunit 7A2-like, mitochondrial isoform X3 [Vicugna pacos]|uniref:Cytochrome c oxidase subunit 7A2-like, mitochondrial isoform X3 n=1 Tax=Vicugna pacos TaxID=30538 RepID=A0ABM5BBZ5_VICPA
MIMDVRCYDRESLSQPRIPQGGSFQASRSREGRSAFFSSRRMFFSWCKTLQFLSHSTRSPGTAVTSGMCHYAAERWRKQGHSVLLSSRASLRLTPEGSGRLWSQAGN